MVRSAKGAFGMGNPAPRPIMDCVHCRRQMNNLAGGFSRGFNNEPLCHPNAKNRPDCYKLVTLYKHPVPCTSTVCYEDHEDLLTYVKGYELKVNT